MIDPEYLSMHHKTPLRENGGALQCRPVVSTDLQNLCNLMDEVGASFGGLASRSMRLAIGLEAVADNRVTVAVADLDGELVGFAAAVVDPVAFWKGFLRRHPVIGAIAVVRKLSTAGRISGLLRGRSTTGSVRWNQSSPTVARILYVGVAERFRGRGIAAQLYRTVFHQLAGYGVQRVEAHIDHDNIPGTRLYARFGGQVQMVNENAALLWTLDLGFIRGEKGAQ